MVGSRLWRCVLVTCFSVIWYAVVSSKLNKDVLHMPFHVASDSSVARYLIQVASRAPSVGRHRFGRGVRGPPHTTACASSSTSRDRKCFRRARLLGALLASQCAMCDLQAYVPSASPYFRLAIGTALVTMMMMMSCRVRFTWAQLPQHVLVGPAREHSWRGAIRL